MFIYIYFYRLYIIFICIYYNFFKLYIYIYFLPSLCNIFVIVCCKVWILGVWVELACHERLFNPPPQFSRLGTWCPNFFCTSVLLSPVRTWMEGWRGGEEGCYLLLCFLFYSIIYILGLVCYKHTIHVVND